MFRQAKLCVEPKIIGGEVVNLASFACAVPKPLAIVYSSLLVPVDPLLAGVK